MKRMTSAFDLGKALTDALGLPKQTIGFTLHVRAGHFVTVECEYVPEGGDLVRELAKYGLVRLDESRKPDPHPADALGYDSWRAQRTELAHREFMRRTSCLPQ